MKAATVAPAIVLAVVIGAAIYVLQGSPAGNQTTTSPPTGSTTLEKILAGRYPSASDKQGTGGVSVEVDHLLVLYVRNESDGDWHVGVTDANISIFITEITPGYQQALGRPVVGTVIDETGIVFCDTFHQAEAWHGNTCWEIHPVTAWHLSAGGSTISAGHYPGSNLNVTFSYAQNPIVRGSVQTVGVRVIDSDGIVSGIVVYFEVDYASGFTTRNFQCTTTADGTCTIAWQIGSSADPGTFQVKASADGVYFYSNFEVTA